MSGGNSNAPSPGPAGCVPSEAGRRAVETAVCVSPACPPRGKMSAGAARPPAGTCGASAAVNSVGARPVSSSGSAPGSGFGPGAGAWIGGGVSTAEGAAENRAARTVLRDVSSSSVSAGGSSAEGPPLCSSASSAFRKLTPCQTASHSPAPPAAQPLSRFSLAAGDGPPSSSKAGVSGRRPSIGNAVTPPIRAGRVPFPQALLLQSGSRRPASRPPRRVRQWNTRPVQPVPFRFSICATAAESAGLRVWSADCMFSVRHGCVNFDGGGGNEGAAGGARSRGQ